MLLEPCGLIRARAWRSVPPSSCRTFTREGAPIFASASLWPAGEHLSWARPSVASVPRVLKVHSWARQWTTPCPAYKNPYDASYGGGKRDAAKEPEDGGNVTALGDSGGADAGLEVGDSGWGGGHATEAGASEPDGGLTPLQPVAPSASQIVFPWSEW
jgi:hypothetical protein